MSSYKSFDINDRQLRTDVQALQSLVSPNMRISLRSPNGKRINASIKTIGQLLQIIEHDQLEFSLGDIFIALPVNYSVQSVDKCLTFMRRIDPGSLSLDKKFINLHLLIADN
jgi:hypothetical protein